MDENAMGRRTVAVGLDSRPELNPHVKFRRDTVRGGWVLLAPERILTPNDEAADVLRLCDGRRTVAEIATELAKTYNKESGAIATDIIPMLQGLADAGVLRS